jgi:hypothetical protein
VLRVAPLRLVGLDELVGDLTKGLLGALLRPLPFTLAFRFSIGSPRRAMVLAMRCAAARALRLSPHVAALRPEQFDALGGKLCIAVQSDVEVTDTSSGQGLVVSQAF